MSDIVIFEEDRQPVEVRLEGELGVPTGARPARGVLGVDEASLALDALAGELHERGEASEILARDWSDSLASILGNLEQSMFGAPARNAPPISCTS